ncbi:GGDEF domain-containing protein [Serratia ficaria]|uniref:GGDEF domain-containing protein n=1 Tax=Serratia ficaria TaxID=61651 RepID=UPI002ED41B8B|nr:GGDEF domain-containing protein [Serratia ficaria]
MKIKGFIDFLCRVKSILERKTIRGEVNHGLSKTIRDRLLYYICVAASFTLLLAAIICIPAYKDYKLATRTVDDIKEFKELSELAILMARERAPTAIIMSREPTVDSLWGASLKKHRDNVDLAFSNLIETYKKIGVTYLNEIKSVHSQLILARSDIDREISINRSELKAGDYQKALSRMLLVADNYQGYMSDRVIEIAKDNKSLAPTLFHALMITDLREHGGQIAGFLVSSLAAQVPLDIENEIAARRNITRTYEIWKLIQVHCQIFGCQSLVEQTKEINNRFFSDAFEPIYTVINESKSSEHYKWTVSEFVNAFSPTLISFSKYRDALLDKAISDAELKRTASIIILIMLIAIIAIVCFIHFYVVFTIRKDIFIPLIKVNEEVLLLSDDRPSEDYSTFKTKEMKEIWRSMEVLRNKIIERKELLGYFRTLSETDSLTGLPNRRALEHIAGEISSVVEGELFSLVIMDVDFFKGINDKYGHATGDIVLRKVASVIRSVLGDAGIIFRYGGEEFAIVLRGHGLDGAIKIAEKLRITLENEIIYSTNNERVCITASFGVASAKGKKETWLQLFSNADKALYRAKKEGRNRVRALFEGEQ